MRRLEGERRELLDDVEIARVLHILAIVHWIGGVAFVTSVALPAVRRFSEPARRFSVFEELERRFSKQAKITVTVAGLTGLYMSYRMGAWDRFTDPRFWWMHSMFLVWLTFTVLLFMAEPLFLQTWLRRRSDRDPDGTFVLIQRSHWILLGWSLITIAAAVLGANGLI
jgi:uncharacterized membrane protein